MITTDPTEAGPAVSAQEQERLDQWQAEGEAVAAVASTFSHKTSTCTVYRKELTSNQRWGRALLALLAGWATAAVTALIPVAHLFLVPLFLVLGVWAARIRLKERYRAIGALVDCPECGVRSVLEPCPEEWPLSLYCGGCRAVLQLNRAD